MSIDALPEITDPEDNAIFYLGIDIGGSEDDRQVTALTIRSAYNPAVEPYPVGVRGQVLIFDGPGDNDVHWGYRTELLPELELPTGVSVADGGTTYDLEWDSPDDSNIDHFNVEVSIRNTGIGSVLPGEWCPCADFAYTTPFDTFTHSYDQDLFDTASLPIFRVRSTDEFERVKSAWVYSEAIDG